MRSPSCRPTSTTGATSISWSSTRTARRRSSGTCATARSRTPPRTGGLLAAVGGAIAVAAGDVNKDGYHRFLLRPRRRARRVRAERRARRLHGAATARRTRPTRRPPQLFDYDNDGLLDLLVAGPRGAHLFRNAGSRWIDVTSETGVGQTAAGQSVRGPRAGRGRSRRRRRHRRGVRSPPPARCGCGATTAAAASRRSACAGRRASATAAASASKVEMRAGSLRQKLETSSATPAVAPADLVFGLGARAAADVVRVLWPSGILQAETRAGRRRRPRAAARSRHRARSQALVVPVPLHLERRAVRVRHRLHGRRRDGLLGRAGRVQHAGPRRVRRAFAAIS